MFVLRLHDYNAIFNIFNNGHMFGLSFIIHIIVYHSIEYSYTQIACPSGLQYRHDTDMAMVQDMS